jgi:hypothetical protein
MRKKRSKTQNTAAKPNRRQDTDWEKIDLKRKKHDKKIKSK